MNGTICNLHLVPVRTCGCTLKFDPRPVPAHKQTDPAKAPGQIINFAKPISVAIDDFLSDEPLVCTRDQSGDTTCESCQ